MLSMHILLFSNYTAVHQGLIFITFTILTNAILNAMVQLVNIMMQIVDVNYVHLVAIYVLVQPLHAQHAIILLKIV
jgi:hypothetical protein